MKAGFPFAIWAILLISSCRSDRDTFDATGTFEATEITVSAEQNGRIFHLNLTEGSRLEAGSEVGLIDTVQLSLKALQLGATREAVAYQRPDISKQVAAIRQQLATARMEEARFKALVADGAANRKQLDDASALVNVLQRQLDAQETALNSSTQSLNSRISATEIQRLEVLDQLGKCHIISPINGTVLAKYAEAGEYATVGRPLFKLADTERMYLRAYLTTAQLRQVKIGQKATVFADYGNLDYERYEGIVQWISDRAEFTPKTILTDDERANQVYAVKIAVKNDGKIKIGMYGKVELEKANATND